MLFLIFVLHPHLLAGADTNNPRSSTRFAFAWGNDISRRIRIVFPKINKVVTAINVLKRDKAARFDANSAPAVSTEFRSSVCQQRVIPEILKTTVKAIFQRNLKSKAEFDKGGFSHRGAFDTASPGQYGRLQWTTSTTLISACSHIEPCSRFGEGKD